jgi:ABC-type Fe3+-hydroxamate transport system substrate-binding protein
VTVGSGVSAEKPPRRIVSLVPSLTELLFALGVGDAVVGVTRYCSDPPECVARVPKVGGTKNPDLAAIATLRPELVVMNDEENRREDFEALSASGLAVLVTGPKTVDDGIRVIASLAAAVGRTEVGARLAATQEAGVAAVRALVRGRRDVPYFCPIWKTPWMAFNADTYAHDVLRVAGGCNVLADRPERYPVVTLEEVAARAPEIVLLPDEPYRFGDRDLPALAPLAATPALRHDAVRFVDGKALAWYGLRIADAVETFARVFAATAGNA